MSTLDEYDGSTRKITHIMPDDGTEHSMVECYCHPEIVEANGVHALMGLEDAGVAEDDWPGALIFTHADAKKGAGGSGRYSLALEADGYEETP